MASHSTPALRQVHVQPVRCPSMPDAVWSPRVDEREGGHAAPGQQAGLCLGIAPREGLAEGVTPAPLR